MKLKKGFVFSVFVITAMALIVMTYRMKVEFREENRAEIYRGRIEQINLFIDDMERDMERALYVTSFRAFLGADEYIHKYMKYIDDVNSRLPELILHGTINGELLNATNSSTFTDWTNRITNLSKSLNIEVEFKNIEIEVKQDDPWKINVSLSADASISDFENVIGWNLSVKKSTLIDIGSANFPDPIYFVESLDNVGNDSNPLLNRIQRSPYDRLWINETMNPFPTNINVDNLLNHTLGQFYWNNTRAPSYLMRLQGNFSNSTYGIESFVNVINNSNIWEFSDAGEATCVVDYQFFSTGCVGDKHRVQNMNNRFYLDWDHLRDYGMTTINST